MDIQQSPNAPRKTTAAERKRQALDFRIYTVDLQ
jgi:hypothetical protein